MDSGTIVLSLFLGIRYVLSWYKIGLRLGQVVGFTFPHFSAGVLVEKRNLGVPHGVCPLLRRLSNPIVLALYWLSSANG